tara:strand:- start:1094 stop:1696 length:603 start_codon:yes stop_codon:yes gene_type:complete
VFQTTNLIGFGARPSSAGGYTFTQSAESEWSGTLSHYDFNGSHIESSQTQNFGIRSDDTFSGDMAFDLTWKVDIPDSQAACGVFNNAEPTASWSGSALNGNMGSMGTNNAFWWQATSSTNLLVYSGGTLDGTVDMPDVNDVMRIRRAGEVWTLEYDDGGDGNFGVIQTFSGTNSSATFRLHVCLYQANDDINSVQWGPAA